MKLLLCLSLFIFSYANQRMYKVNYYNSGLRKSEGWMQNGKKHDYWTFFHQNGKIASQGNFNEGMKDGYWFYYNKNGFKTKEGHYKQNTPTKWWVYYHNNIYENCLYQPDGKTRFCLTYENNTITMAKKYVNDVFLQQWTSIPNFKRDNPSIKF